MSNLDKEQYQKSISIVDSICKSFGSFNEVDQALRIIFTKLNNPEDKRMEEVSKSYDLMGIITSKSKLLKDYKMSKQEFLSPRFYFYEHAPYGFLLMLNSFEKIGANWVPNNIGIYINEDKNKLF